jgi:ABC-type dipeptide/oligopeptide/nickel transport system permease component
MSGLYLLRRLLLAVPTLFGVAVIVFILLRVVPGDPIAMMLPPGARAGDIENLRRLYGLDRSIFVQFIHWLPAVLHGDFGTSISLRRSVLPLILDHLPATLELAGLAFLIAVTVGGALGLVAAYWRTHWPEAVVDAIAGFVQAVPDFLWGLVFILLLGVAVPVLPISGRIDPVIDVAFATNFYLAESLVRGRFELLLDLLRHIVLPAVALALPLAAIIARVLKLSLAEAITQDYALMAEARGFSRWHILLREALRNAAIPTVALSGVQFTFLLGGTVLIERIFSYPGIGNLAIGSVIDRDLPLIQGLILTFAVLFLLINLLVDLSCALLNPRLRHG